MPLYDYACPKCGTTEEVIRGMTEDKEFLCPKCETIMEQIIGSKISVRCNWDDPLPDNPDISREKLING